jgi:microcystin-dependent protein
MPTTTTHYGLLKPLVNNPTDQDLWGGYLNENMDTLDTVIYDGISTAFPVGGVVMLPTNNAPAGFVLMQGQLLSRTGTYARLWTFANASGNIGSDANWLAGTITGAFSYGDGATNFRLPDPRGLFMRVLDNGRGVDTGRLMYARQDDAFESHTHTPTLTDPGHKHKDGDSPVNTNVRYGVATGLSSGNKNDQSGTSTTGAYSSTDTTGITLSIASTGGAETRPQNLAWPLFIKY